MISPAVYELKISLAEVNPEVWRTFQLPGSVSLRKLHKIIQHVMGWEDYHLYSFDKAGIVFGRPIQIISMTPSAIRGLPCIACSSGKAIISSTPTISATAGSTI